MELPPGFQLENQARPELPAGFELEQPTQQSGLGPALGRVYENPSRDVPGSIKLPIIGKPSLIGMAKNIYEGITLPGEVLEGKVNPESDEALRRTLGLAGTIALGTTAAPAGALGSGMVRPAVKSSITPRELIQEGAAGFKQARASADTVSPNQVLDYVARARNDLANEGKTRSLAPGAQGALDELETSANAAAAAGQPMQAPGLVAFRQTLTDFTKTPSSNSAAAGIAKSAYDDWLKTAAPNLSSDLTAAVANTRVGHLGADIVSPANRAQLQANVANSGMNIENKLRSSLASTLAKEEDRLMRGRQTRFSPEIRQDMAAIANGNLGGNARRTVGNMLGGGGGLAASIYGLASLATHPGLALAPFGGMALKALGNRATAKKLDQLAQKVMASAPAAQTRKALANLYAELAAPQPTGGLFGLLARNPQGLLPLLSPPIATPIQQ